MSEIRAECRECGGSGLYRGMCEGEGEAVVCLRCDGTGCQVIRYIPYSGRRVKRGIKSVEVSRGAFIATGVGGIGEKMTYKEFQERFPAASI